MTSTIGRRLSAAVVVAVSLTSVAAPNASAVAARQAADTRAPYAPKQLTAATADGTSVRLSWQPAVDDVGVVEYRVFRNGTEITSTVDTRVTLTAQPENRTLYYQVLAVDAAGNRSVKTAPVTATIDTIKPSAPTRFVATQVAVIGPAIPALANWIDLTIDRAPTATDVVSYVIWRNGVEVMSFPVLNPGRFSDSVRIQGQPVGETIWFQGQWVDRAGNRSAKSAPWAVCLCDVTAPTTPTNVVVTKKGTGVHISWDPSSDASSPQAPIVYFVRINNVLQLGGLPSNQWHLLTQTSLDFPDLPVGQPLTFDVVAMDNVRNVSPKSTPVTITL